MTGIRIMVETRASTVSVEFAGPAKKLLQSGRQAKIRIAISASNAIIHPISIESRTWITRGDRFDCFAARTATERTTTATQMRCVF